MAATTFARKDSPLAERSVEVRSVDGSVVGSVALAPELFGIEPNRAVLHQVVTAQLAAARAGTQSTRTRAEVSGGGRKPFKQKGTGRARQGSERAPQFTGGGVALGPKPRSYRQRTPRKMIQLALRSALSDRAADGRVVVVDAWPWEEPSTKGAKAALGALGIEGRVLVVVDRDQEEAYKSFRNLPGVQLLLGPELNAYDVLRNDSLVFSLATLPPLGADDGGTAVAVAAPTLVPAADAGPADSPAEPVVADPAEPVDDAAEPVAAGDGEPADDAAAAADEEEDA